MRTRNITHAAVVVALGTTLGLTVHARRSGTPTDGVPYPANAYSRFYSADGVVYHSNTADYDNWDLTPHIDSAGSKNMRISAKGSASVGTSCWGVAVDSNGSGSIGNSQGTPAGCSGAPGIITTPNVTVATNGTFLVTCRMPPAQTCDPQLVHYRVTQ